MQDGQDQDLYGVFFTNGFHKRKKNVFNQVQIAKRYGGSYYFDSNSDTTNSLNEAFGRNPCGDDPDDDDKDIPLLSAAGILTDGEKFALQ